MSAIVAHPHVGCRPRRDRGRAILDDPPRPVTRVLDVLGRHNCSLVLAARPMISLADPPPPEAVSER
jgi:hypothetical protein